MDKARKDDKKDRTVDYFEHYTHIGFSLSFYFYGDADNCTITIKCGEEGLNSYYNISVCFGTGFDFLRRKK